MMELPLISIVTPSYNQAQFLEETLRSVAAQDYPRKEHIVIDGGSTDSSVDIIRRYEPHLRYWVSEPDRGQSHAINKGLRVATGDVLAWLNSDDTYMPGALSRVGALFAAHPGVDLAYGDFLYTDMAGRAMRRRRVFSSMSYESLLYHDYLGQPAVFFRRSLLEQVGLLDEALHYCMDWDLFLRMWRVCRPQHVPQVLATYRLDRQAKSNAEDTAAAIAAAHLVQQRHMNRRFSRPGVNRAWHRACFYASFLVRAGAVIRDNPFDYIRTLHQMFPGRRLLRVLGARLRSPF
jgi:glycosyltransferase involved in cell wall biosynthesis